MLFPHKIKVVDHSFPSRSEYRGWLIEGGFRDRVEDPRAQRHSASPVVWISGPDSANTDPDPSGVASFIGGHDDTLAWCRAYCAPSGDAPASSVAGPEMVNDGHAADHGFDYDVVVIGGGSGGLAASKECSKLGANVAVLDFVKPSPAGTKWGLGGTCVNVGCIPKKLMHNAAIIKETIKSDAAAFGIGMPKNGGGEEIPAELQADHAWEAMRGNVQNHIRSLNFKYRVDLRENGVTYLNKMGKFKDAHTLEVTDKKGRVSEITSSRFIVAVGGRPTTLDCEGGELAITSDDIFALEKSPGKTLCVGASYIALECAGFLAGVGHDVTVAVRSILLRGFDRECADKIGSYMDDHGVKFRKGVVPQKLEKVDGDRIEVTFSDGQTEVYDTVLVAIGRKADTESLGLENTGIETDSGNLKIPTKLEQTSCPNIYAVGDVMVGCPELTPVAIQAGKMLARRLFGGSKEPMDYRNICTTVFTPLEYGTVGYSEDEAIEEFGEDNIEVYHKSFIPLEWTMSDARSCHQAFTKVIMSKIDDKVLGIHYLGPNAGEVLQGYGTAMKKGITFQDLVDTVGIHPTCSEEIVTLRVTKSSGEDAAAGGC